MPVPLRSDLLPTNPTVLPLLVSLRLWLALWCLLPYWPFSISSSAFSRCLLTSSAG
jgi:hypothetical protein